ncbi:hypothetical protein V494_02783 [Pseudogymnoascus sp. VKM F-4513 (FW-928)]|nr:hypothetical protein V494_02783 [Pseudogymnoascus sp. VKM F-4513 (FW-928)]
MPQTPTFHPFHVCISMHIAVDAEFLWSPRDADSQALLASLARAYAESANLRSSISCLCANHGSGTKGDVKEPAVA